ncbi:hypothetical protein AIOL_001076 [Candidatus Rhodobacter oscarellae]|uniref:ABM domain-containing protein n=1 Tax=Candidatus Rhodobacter oscarellae TaxID=1675527 RepID=A0A0J9E2W9_9RHOB|nr:antibiotic biosynthesis monooxygenase [Candidatus Rhodobacter lobularis]KMW56124.1 hypothetical protein AIOL_001076 [Candidatus Rhodobacter lobularis]
MTITQKAKTLAAATALALTGAAATAGSTEIDLTYVWTAKPGMEQQLIATYDQVGGVLEANEPGLLVYEIAVSETGHQLVIREVFEDGQALGYHLSETAAKFFPQISQIATPGPFIFRGDVPEELKQAAYAMDMGAIFTGDWDGFSR